MKIDQIVPQGFAGLLYEDGAFQEELAAGRHQRGRLLFDDVKRELKLVDLRERSVTIKGQEILTADKAALRISLLVYFRVTDPKAALHNVTSYEERIYEDVQLAARRFLASRALPDILTDRNDISEAVKADVKAAAAGYGVEILRADVKDLVFPGNLREIMNQVLEVERRAEAKLIEARREAEVTRIKTEAETAAAKAKLDLMKEQSRAAAEAEREVTRIKTEAETAAARVKLDLMKDSSRANAEAERERARLKLETDLEEAKALAANPRLVKLKELAALTDMARGGGKFVMGLEAKGLSAVLREEK